ncbi:hypothetical protein CZ809_02390 [Photobacterium piscicola]|uniref:Uncharacterized protein n=1 Tax=Photobacterium piscicola TaxID=1378299 RepID=A0A1T5I1H1_9GAMM|nr:hypothetical protein [Photobacterium piscicola]SKC32862.1 hypothetical protein CZ809_02390 [Photobacterium piscicola]
MSISRNNEQSIKSLQVNQANVFYNYSIGFDCSKIDLLKTGARLLKSGVATSIFYSDFKCIYIDNLGNTQIEVLRPEGRNWDSNWKIEFSENIPKQIAIELTNSCEIAFHENHFHNECRSYLRTSLPPIVLVHEDYQLPIFTSVKIFSDGIAILSFQLDATWEKLEESLFISDVVNIFKCYFKSIWIDSKLQYLDAKVVLDNAFEDNFTIGGELFTGLKIRRLINKMKRDSQVVLDDALKVKGHSFHLGGCDWELHQIAGTADSDLWESTIEQCRSIYSNSISTLIVSSNKVEKEPSISFMWQGRPSISLLRYEDQPQTKVELYNNFSSSISKILLRSEGIVNLPELPPDLRLFDDFSLHANRAVLLWTWLKSKHDPESAWDDPNTCTKVFENQARTEQIEYHNLKIARACSWAQRPINSNYLLNAYETLASSNSLIHHSSNSGEVTEALSYLINAFGTASLVEPSKEAARYHLDELKYISDRARNRSDSWLTFIFGLVGTTSLADFAIEPFIKDLWPTLSNIQSPIVSFCVSGSLILLIALVIWLINRKKC